MLFSRRLREGSVLRRRMPLNRFTHFVTATTVVVATVGIASLVFSSSQRQPVSAVRSVVAPHEHKSTREQGSGWTSRASRPHAAASMRSADAAAVPTWLAVNRLLPSSGKKSSRPAPLRTLASLDSYRTAVLSDTPVALWELDESTGTSAADSSGNGRSGTYTGTFTHSTNVAPIGADNLGSFGVAGASSTSVNASIPATALNTATGTFNTVELWMYWDGTGTGEGVFNFQSSTFAYALWLNASSIGFITGNGEIWGMSNAGLANGWHLIDAEFENGTLNLSKLYIDGTARTLTMSGANQNVSIVSSGGNVATKISGWAAGSSNTFRGQIDEVSIFRGALSSAQITAHWTGVLGAPSNNVAPNVTGSKGDGDTLTADHGTWTGSPTTYSYQWLRCDSTGASCTDVAGSTGSTYRLADGDVGSAMRVAVTASNDAGAGMAAPSAPSVPIFTLAAPRIGGMDAAASSAGAWGYWRFDDASGIAAADRTGNGHPLTVDVRARGGIPQWGKAGAAKDSTALHLRGNPTSQTAGDRAYLGAGTISQFTNNFTVEGRFKVIGLSPVWTVQTLFGFGNPLASPSTAGWEVLVDNDKLLSLWLQGAEVWHGPAMPLGKWAHVALTSSGGVWTIYLNGMDVGQVTHAETTPTSFDFYFGGDPGTGGGFNLVGDIAAGAFYTSVLGAGEIASHAKALTEPSVSPGQSLGPIGGGVGLNPGGSQAEPVDTATGNFYTDVTDLQTAGAGVPFAFTRTYNSGDTRNGRLGRGWSDSLDWTATTQTDGGIVVRSGSGQQLHFTLLADGSFAADGGGRATLATFAGTGHELLTNDQVHYLFDSSGRLTGETDRNGQGLTLAYDSNGLSTVTDSAGRIVNVTITSGKITKIQLPNSGGSVSFAYTGGLLSTVTDALGGTTNYTYDAGNRLATTQDPTHTTVLTNTYDSSSGRVTDQMDARGKHTAFTWDPVTQIATTSDPNGKVWKDVYGNGVLLKQIDATNNATFSTRDGNLGLTSVSSPSGDQTTMTYDAKGNILNATAPVSLGSVQKTFTYDVKNNVTSVTDAKGNVTTNTYDTGGNLTAVKLNNVQIAAYTYNTAGQKLTSTDGNSHTTTYTYDSDGNVASVTDPLGNATSYTYDADGRVLTKGDPLGNAIGANPADYTTGYAYDAAGNLLTETDPLAHTTTNTYDAAGRVLTTTDPNGHTTTNTYDATGNLLSITGADPDGAGPLLAPVTSYAYDDAGNKLTQTDPNNHTTTFTYDASNRLLSETTAEGNKTTYSYDANGNQASVTDPRGNVLGANPADYTTTFTYDAAGRKLASNDPLGHVTTYTYDAVGNRSSVKDANNHTTSYTVDASGRVLTVTAPDGGVTTYAYDGNGKVLTRIDDNNHATTSVYDDGGNLVQVTGPDPDGSGPLSAPVTTRTYDANGNLTSTTDPNGNATPSSGDGTTTRTYDDANRLTDVVYSDSTPDVSYSYDAAGNRNGMTDGAGSVTYTRDNLNRVTFVTRGSDTFSYSYDAAGNVTSRTFPGGLTTSYTHDGDNLMASATSAGATTSYSYDPAGNLTRTTLPSGNGYVETRIYDDAGRLIDVKNADGPSILSEFASTLDPAGNPIEIVRSGATSSTSTYGYDVNDRLTSICYQASCPNSTDPYIRWTYDKVGNRLTETRSSGTTGYTYDALDELTQAGSTHYTYDANGNELTAGSNTYTYNLLNQMSSASDGAATTNFSYDGDGNRVESSSGPAASATTISLWDTNAADAVSQLAVERDGSGSPLRSYTYGVSRISMASDGKELFYHYDLIGSVANVTESTGSSDWTYAYDPFGVIRTETRNDSSAPNNPMQFAGEYNDPIGLYNLRARQYDPTIGRMLAADPVEVATGDPFGSSFAYVGNRPTVMVDPSGQTARPSGAGQGAAGGATSAGPDCLLPVWFNVCADPPLLKPVIAFVIGTSGTTLPLLAGAVATLICGPCGVVVTIAVSAAAAGATKGLVTKYVEGKSTKTAVQAGTIELVTSSGKGFALKAGERELARFLVNERIRNTISVEIWSRTVVRHLSIP
jgi:RHS repeat-associated protein